MQLLLEMQGVEISFERWGIDTMKRLERFAPVDLILLDLMFPGGITGYDVFDQIRANPDYATIPIIAVSASEPAISIPKTKAKGFKGFIAKPINFDAFPEQIRLILNGQEIWEA